MTLRIGSLCSGYEGLGMAVMDVIGGELAWVADNDKGAGAILAHRFPDVPNLGDITETDWAAVEPVDILTAGFPCQDVSCAGGRTGLREGNRSGVWSYVAAAIDALQPPLVVLENVRGLLSAKADSNLEWCPWCLGDTDPELAVRALGAVLGDLADLGFDADWQCVRASDVGAPHQRERVFITAWPAADAERKPVRVRARGLSASPGEAERPRAERQWLRADDGDGCEDAPDSAVGRRDGRSAGRRDGRHPALRSEAGRDYGYGSGAPAEDADSTAGSEWREPAPGEAPGRRPRPDAGGPGGASTPADAERDGLEGQRRDAGPGEGRQAADGGRRRSARVDPSVALSEGNRRIEGRPEPAGLVGRSDAAERGNGSTPDPDGRAGAGRPDEPLGGQDRRAAPDRPGPVGVAWGTYEPAIRKWERVLGRPAPRPVEPGRTGERLSPRFVEWMMGLPDGWVTDVPGLARNAQLKALGNGVVPQQAALALRMLLADATERAA